MALLIKQWGKNTIAQNEYLVQAYADLATDIPSPEFGDMAYAIDEHTHYIFGTSWEEYFAPSVTNTPSA